jgi:hypothetical protein
MLFGNEMGTIRVQDVSHFVHKRISKVQLVSLNHAGFITFSASKPLALEVEVEEEKEVVPTPVDNSTSPYGPIVRRPRNEPALLSQAFEIVNNWEGGPSQDLDELLDALERKLSGKLKLSERARLWDHARNHIQ